MVFQKGNNANPLGTWRKGQSGNPAGRAKQTPDFLAQARAEGPASLQTLVKLRDDPDIDANIRRQCANDILDRAYGKPVQQIETDITAKAYLVVPDRRSAEALTHDDANIIDLTPDTLPVDD
jgi:hypothetical protein